MMRPRCGSYGDTATATRSPTMMRILFFITRPHICARTRHRVCAENPSHALTIEVGSGTPYDLAKLRGKKLVDRVEGSRRYKADPCGVRTMCAYLILRDKVIKPLLAGVVRPLRPAPKVQAPVDQHYVRLREELNRTFETIGLAPA